MPGRASLSSITALAAGLIFGQAPDRSNTIAGGQEDARLTFDAASVRIHVDSQVSPPPGWHGGPGTNDPGQITYGNVPLFSLLQDAFRIRSNRIGPESIRQVDERYDVVVKIPPGTSIQQMGIMLQNLLKDRFHMVAHRETKEEPIYELVVGKNGPKVTAAATADPANAIPYRPGVFDQEGFPQIPPGRQMLLLVPAPDGGMRLTARMQPISNLAASLEAVVERPIVDKTGLTGKYDFRLAFSGALSAPNSGTEPTDSSTGVFDALQTQLGLKLQSAKGMVERVVVDHIDRTPTDN